MKMVSRKITAIYTGSLIFISAILLIICCGIQFIHYDQLISLIVLKLKKPELEGLLRSRAFTDDKFRLLQKLMRAGLFVVPVIIFILYKTKSSILHWSLFILQTIRLILNDPKSLRYKPFSVTDHYDCVVRNAGTLNASTAEKKKFLYRQPDQGFEIFLLK
jgi:hypothetical protein